MIFRLKNGWRRVVNSIDRQMAALRESSARLEHDLANVTVRARSSGRSYDTSRRVSIEWDDRGPRLKIDDGWERDISASGLPAAVSEAMTTALSKRYSDDGLNSGDEEWERPVVQVESPGLGAALAADPRFAAAIRRPDFAARLSVVLSEAERRAVLRRSGSGPNGAVSVELDHAGQISGYRVDSAVAAGRSGGELTADAAAAVEDAFRRFSSVVPSLRPLNETDVIEELRA